MIGLQCWTEISLERFKADGLIGQNTFYSENASRLIELLLRSHATITLLALCVINAIVLFILSIKVNFLHCMTLALNYSFMAFNLRPFCFAYLLLHLEMCICSSGSFLLVLGDISAAILFMLLMQWIPEVLWVMLCILDWRNGQMPIYKT